MKTQLAKTPVFAPEIFKPDADSVQAMISRIKKRTEDKTATAQILRVATDRS